MELEDEVHGGGGAGVLHPVGAICSVEDDAVRADFFAKRFDGAAENDDDDLIGVGVWRIAAAGLKGRHMAVEFAQVLCAGVQERCCGKAVGIWMRVRLSLLWQPNN